MSRGFEPRYLSFDSSIATSQRRLYSTILAEFPWHSEALALRPESILAHCESLPEYESFLSSLHAFEDALLDFGGKPYMKEIRGLLGMKVIANENLDSGCCIMAAHEITLSLFDFQKICSVLCAYRFFEIISLRARCISRIPVSTPTASMFLPGPRSVKDDLDAFSRLHNWPKLVKDFRRLVQNATNSGNSQFHAFPNPVFTLMHMAARNNAATKYLAIEENFLLAAIHIAAMKNIPFNEGSLPDLPANMPSVPSGGFKDQDSYDHFELEFNAFIKKCQTEGPPSTAHVGPRSPFQLAVMISPLYLLVTQRLSTKSFHRRTVIELAASLGPHRPSCVWAVENVIWDALFRLAEGRISVCTALRELVDSLPWSDLDIASNCEADGQWFAPKLLSGYDLSVSSPTSNSSGWNSASQSSTITDSSSRNNDQGRLLHPSPSITESASSASLVSLNGLLNRESQSPPVNIPLSQGHEDHIVNYSKAVDTVDVSQNSFTQPQILPALSPQPTSPSQSPVHSEMTANYRVISRVEDHDRNFVANASANQGPPQNDTFNCSIDFNVLARSKPHSKCSLDTLSNSDSSLSDTESDREESTVPRRGGNAQDWGNGSDLNDGHFNERSANGSSSTEGFISPAHYLDDHSRDNSESESIMRVNSITKIAQVSAKTSNDISDDDMDDNHSKHARTSPNSRKPIESRVKSPAGMSTLSGRADRGVKGTKRRRSPSLVPPGLGSKENPIDVDTVASLFEPIVAREYVKKEKITLPIKATPPIKGNRVYTIYDARGETLSFTPSFHFKVYHERFHQFITRVEASYDNGRPLHIARPDSSIVKSFTYAEWKLLTPTQMQQEQMNKNIIVTGWPDKDEIFFNEEGLRKVAGTPSRQISINDYSIKPSASSCGPTVVSGHVRDLWDNRNPFGRILNALDLPLYDGNTEPTEYASDLHAWGVTRGHHHIDQTTPYPTDHMRWALVGHENSMTFLHIDCEGLSTDIRVTDGGKAWGFLRERPGNPLSSVDFFLKESFRLDQVLSSSDYDFELVALRPGDRLFMMPSQPHFVFGYAHSICIGGHYYLTNHMQKTLQGLIHSFILHKFLTNISHPTRILLRRMVLFYHMGLLEAQIPDSDPAASHLPDINSIDGLISLLSACVLVILGNVLDFRTYRAPTQEEYKKADKNQQILIDNEFNTIPANERFAICYARGVALRLLDWIRHCSVITGPGGEVISDLPSGFFVQIAQTLLKYKEGANASKLDLQANCTLDMLGKQVDNVVAIDPHISSMWSERHLLPSDSLALSNQDGYSIRWLPNVQCSWSSVPHDFFRDGITGLDERYFNSQHTRLRLESSLLIPQFKKDSSASQHTYKRARLG